MALSGNNISAAILFTVTQGRVVQYTQLESIRLWYLRFDKREIDSWTLFRRIHTKSFPLLLIRHAGSRFARDLENIVDLDFEGGLKMLSIRVDSIESTEVCGHVLRTRKVHVSLFHRSCLPVGFVGWVENVVDSTRFDRFEEHKALRLDILQNSLGLAMANLQLTHCKPSMNSNAT